MTTRPTDEEIRIELENGKYTIIQHKDGRIEACGIKINEVWP